MTPFKKAAFTAASQDAVDNLRRLARVKHIDFEHDVIPRLSDHPGELFVNDEYQVIRETLGPVVHLSIKRTDGSELRSWRDLQQIKNELVGPEHEAVELFPAESRLIDSAFQYHLWVAVDPHYRFPFGFDAGRFVT